MTASRHHSATRAALSRGRPLRLALSAALGMVGYALTPSSAEAQDRLDVTRTGDSLRVEVVHLSPPRGWIGVSFAPIPEGDGSVRVLRVVDGSPAARAGLREGDLLLQIQGQPAARALRGVVGRITPGDSVRLFVRRDGWEQNFTVAAAPRPLFVTGADGEILVRLDSLRAAPGLSAFRGIERDSLLDIEFDVRWEAETAPVSGSFFFREGDDVTRVRMAFPDGLTSVPFPVLAARDERVDSLLGELRNLGTRKTLVERRQADLLRTRGNERDPEVVTLMAQSDQLRRTIEEVRGQLQRASIEVLTRSDRGPAVRTGPSSNTIQIRERPREATAEYRATVRPLAPYILGQDVVAGARMTPVNPELGSYFGGVRQGLLVIEVVPETPAADLDLRPGDVVIRVGEIEVATLDQVRKAIAVGDGLRFGIVRRGREMTLTGGTREASGGR